MIKTLDINCDMGESFGNWTMGDDERVMGLITTANVACGFHAGDPVTLAKTVALAKQHNVAVGAHPGLPDLLGFGRRVMPLTTEESYAYVMYQAGAVKAFVEAQGLKLNHIKPHGAMFHVMRDEALANAALDALTDIDPSIAVYWIGPFGREPLTRLAAERGLTVVNEYYPDLDYSADGSLIVERKKAHIEPSAIYDRVSQVLKDKEYTNGKGDTIPMEVQSICIHGDGPNAVDVLHASRKAAEDAGVKIACATR